jgi:hypothetical protein
MTNPQRIGIDLAEQKILANIAEFGWHAMNIIEDDGHPPWTFTIGLYETWKHPELIIIGRSRSTAHEMLTTIATEIEENRPSDLSENPRLGAGADIVRIRGINQGLGAGQMPESVDDPVVCDPPQPRRDAFDALHQSVGGHELDKRVLHNVLDLTEVGDLAAHKCP